MDENVVRESILQLLKGGQAHMSFEEAVKEFPQEAMNTIFPNGTYSSWNLLEHIRRTQHDILDFMLNPNYKELEWPKDYWPEAKAKATQKEWDKTIEQYLQDKKELEKLLMDKKINLSTKVPFGDGQTYIREFLLVCDHNAYHIGEFAIMRQTLNTWEK
ncbi:MAG TPA: DinB family protein [Patescibacteria group bacterium]|nr:DinB family protein [Patescibacteria group bacterium]